jgi:hypothetical protein
MTTHWAASEKSIIGLRSHMRIMRTESTCTCTAAVCVCVCVYVVVVVVGARDQAGTATFPMQCTAGGWRLRAWGWAALRARPSARAAATMARVCAETGSRGSRKLGPGSWVACSWGPGS